MTKTSINTNRKDNMKKIIIAAILIGLLSCQAYTWEFISVADFVNRDYLTRQQALKTRQTLNHIKSQDPDFVLIPGDMVMGFWYWSRGKIEKEGTKIYQKWQSWFKSRGLKYYTAIGDHELGDLPTANLLLQNIFYDQFQGTYRDNFDYPQNGPKSLKELAYYFTHEDTLIVTVQTFKRDFWVKPQMSKAQLDWLEYILRQYKNEVRHIIVQGHVPVLPVTGGVDSSNLSYEEGRSSRFWQIMAQNGVDFYLCGERHILDIKERDGVTQIVHGGVPSVSNVNLVIFNIGKEINYNIKVIKK